MADTSFNPFATTIEASGPSTDPQREIWTATRLSDEASLAFNESVSLRLRGQLQIDALRLALFDVLARHDALRATFSDDGLSFLVSAAEPVDLPEHDWSSLTEAEYQERLGALLKRVVNVPFALEQGPLIRFELVRRADDDHLLVISAHHIVCDGWSTGVIITELATLYNQTLGVTVEPLAPAETFVEYAEQLVIGEAIDVAADRKYWLERFSGELPVLELPTDRARPALRTYEAEREDMVLPASLIGAVRKATAREGSSLFAGMLAGFGALLQRLTQQDDIVVGVPVAGQSVGHPTLVGHAVNMVPIRMQFAETTSFSDLVRSVRGAMLDAQDHQHLSFGALLQLLPIARDPSRSPLVSVIFNFDKGVTPAMMPFDGVTASMHSTPRTFENFELFVNAVDLDGEVTLEVQYNTSLFDRATIQRWCALYRRLLELIAAEDMKTQLRALPLLSDADREQIESVQGFVQELPEKPLVHLLIDAQCRANPTAVAVEFDGKTITYGELGERANKLAEHLVNAGVTPGMPVGLCVERSIEMIVAQQGILRAGGAYLPLDPDYPSDRLAFMIEDSAMAVVIAQESTRGQIPGGANIVLIDRDADAIAARSASFAPVIVDPSSPCYIIYTSGSTGKPKGVLNPHIAATNLILSVQKVPGMKQSDRVLAITTLSFDIALSELVLPLTVGARIVLASREIATDGVRLKNLIESAGVTFIDATPATYRLLLAAEWKGDPKLTVICTGEAMPKDIAVALVDRAGKVWNGYGPTETTVWSTFYEVTKPVTRILIGKPVANTQVYVLDAMRQAVPFGVRGELYIGGVGVALGYLHRPDLTEQRFVPDPFSDRPNATMYRTGDVVRLLQSGDLDYLGRNDNQVKLRGFRIELGEIEDALLHHESVKQAAVIVREDRPGDKRLVGYISVGADKVPDAELRAHVKKTLPDYMTPQAFVTMPTLPLTPSGKIDRKALPAPDMNAAAGEDFVAPRTEAEKIVSELWGEALGIGRMSMVDDFFALGGHSLLASQVLARLRRDYGVNLPFRKIFEAPTIEQFAKLVEEKQANEPAAVEQKPIPKRPNEAWAPLSVMQERLWLLEEMEPRQRAVHNLGVSWRLKGKINIPALETSLQSFVDRHAIMRTGIQVVDGVPRQAIAPHAKMALTHVDMSNLSAGELDRTVLEFMHNEERVPFDISVPPLMRAWLIRVADDDHILFSIRHNIIWDGWSFDLFVKELSEVYAAQIEGREPKLRALGIEYADFAAWQREFNRGPEMTAQTEFWRKQLAQMPEPLELATDRARPAKPTFEGDRVDIDIDADEVNALTTLAREQGSTLFMVLFSAFSVVLSRWSDQSDLIVGTPMRARTRPEMEDVIGPFVNTLGIRVRFNPDRPFSEMLHGVRDVTLESFGHQEMPFELLGSRPPVIRALFSLQDAKARPTRMGNLSVLQLHTPGRTATNDLMLWTMERTNGMLLALNYSADIFDRETAERFLAQFHTALRSVARDPSRAVRDLEILPAAERAVLTDGVMDLGGGDAINVAADLAKRLDIGATDVVASLGVVDAGLENQLAGIGARVVSVDSTTDDEALARTLTDNGVTIMIAPESRWRSLIGAGWTGSARFTAVVVDSPVASANLEWLRSTVGRLFTIYSDDTLGGWLSLADVSADVDGIPLGRPLGAARFFVLDATGQLAPIGVTGLLHVGGVKPANADGAYGTVTPEFLPSGVSLFATRDRVRRTVHGSFELIQADADRPWLDGHRTGLGDIERKIASHPTVAQAASVVRRDPAGRVRHVAYVVWRQGEFGDVNDLRFDLRKTLSSWLVPHLVVEVEEMPRVGGHVDRRGLPWPFESRKPDFVPPNTDAEKMLAKAWADALGLERVSAHDNFFDLGGYSLLAFRMIDALAAERGVRVNPRLLLLGTLEQAAAQLEVAAPVAAPPTEERQAGEGGMFSKLRGIISGSR
ncbi:MAG TPA: amino acid adenylation domain-containing protein [Gemmatimonadaceae bacterium]|jgi:amino acid adenylation domain-containing protein